MAFSVKCYNHTDTIGYVLYYTINKFSLLYFYNIWRTEKYTGKIVHIPRSVYWISFCPHANQILPNLPAQNKRLNTGLAYDNTEMDLIEIEGMGY